MLEAAGITGACADIDCCELLAWLFSPEKSINLYPVKNQSPMRKAAFLSEQWEPFLAVVRGHLHSTIARAKAGFSLHEVMPSHDVLNALTERCQELTEAWHGRANIGMVYEFFTEMAEHDGHSPYMFRDIPQQRSEDGYVRLLDGQVRQTLYRSHSKAVTTEATTKPIPLVGRIQQTAGESPIDNLQLPNLMPRKTALLLTCGHRIQQFLVGVLRWKQRRILQLLFPDTDAEAMADINAVKTKAWDLQLSEEEPSLALTMLTRHGCLVESYGQVPSDTRYAAEKFIADSLSKLETERDEELDSFMQHVTKHPGRPFNEDHVEHKTMLLRSMKSRSVRLVFRSVVEKFCQHRYITIAWTRRAPLLYLPDGAEDFTVLRKPGAEELTRFRKNVFAYGESHALGQSGGGWSDSQRWSPGSLMYELGPLLCVDDDAKLPNHYVTDIEKIIRDCMVLCPDGGMADALPGETLHDSGQNPVVASSIGKTQHTQASKASAEEFPLMAEKNRPRWCPHMQAFLDIIQVGESEDAFFVSGRSRQPDTQRFLEFFVELREDGDFIFVMAPVACMQKVRVPKGQGCMGLDFDFENPDLGERVTQKNLPIATVDASQGKGNFLINTKEHWRMAMEGRPVLVRLPL
ncbi:unnamed protein product [Symbiodinium pilosum]|uniref:Uncharacterized protein n=1 Tax=Symbiodinium pilosum TaxID=2952 RepID=A0A812QG45_SYMPI|nr:unnamed protein product [Symbiodinium pilosum]